MTELQTEVSTTSAQPKATHWVMLAVASTTLFTASNFGMNGLAPLGVSGLIYFNTGANFVCIAYYLYKWLRRDEKSENRKVLVNPEGKFDWTVLGYLIATGALQILCTMSIIVTFQLAKQANLNIGIVSALWSLCPFGTALLDWSIYRVLPKQSHVIGMILLMICAVLVSLSGLLTDPTEEQEEATLPVYVPVLTSFTLVPIVAFYILCSKHVTSDLKVNANDWTCAYSLCVFMPLQAIGVAYFVANPGTFDWTYFCWGLLSAFEVLGCVVFNTMLEMPNAPVGPMLALMNIGIIEMLLIDSAVSATFPHWMQLVGFVFGLIGAMILSAPDLMYGWWLSLTCRKPESDNNFKAV